MASMLSAPRGDTPSQGVVDFPRKYDNFAASQNFSAKPENVANNIAVNNTEEEPFIERLVKEGGIDRSQIIQLLTLGQPKNIVQYSEHIYKLLSILYEHQHLTPEQFKVLESKAIGLFENLRMYVETRDLSRPKLYLIVEKNFDILIKLSLTDTSLNLSTKSIRFLTEVIMELNYWEIYNLLNWKPAIYHFLTMIQFNLNECYLRFVKDYSNYKYQQLLVPFNRDNVGKRLRRLTNQSNDADDMEEDSDDGYMTGSNTPMDDGFDSHRDSITTVDRQAGMDDDSFINNDVNSLAPRDPDSPDDFKNTRKIGRRNTIRVSTKSSNYDPDVVHECQLQSADEPGRMCLRRFSRKYELIRHQETVHSKKKKLFKCFVCVKQNPGIGPRIFTRHDTLAKHIRVNHKISGKEAKAEVAYSKKNAEVVEEGDITVHVGRRKTKVDFELRAHMEKKRGKDADDYGDYPYEEYDDRRRIIVDEEDEEDENEGDSFIVNTSHSPEAKSIPSTDMTSSQTQPSQPQPKIQQMVPPGFQPQIAQAQIGQQVFQVQPINYQPGPPMVIQNQPIQNQLLGNPNPQDNSNGQNIHKLAPIGQPMAPSNPPKSQ